MKPRTFMMCSIPALGLIATGLFAAGAAEATSSPEPMVISYFGYNLGEIIDDNYCESLIEEAMGIEIVARKVNHGNKEQVDLMLASGDMPDCGWFDNNYAPQYMYYDQELSQNIPVSLIRRYAPGFIKTYDEFPILYKQVTVKENSSEHYGLSGHQAFLMGRQYFFASYYRKDWLDKFGIKPATPIEEVVDGVFITERGFTLAQFEQILERFTNGDPDGNGKDDTTGWIGGIRWLDYDPLLGAFGLISNFSVEDNGHAVYYYSTDRYRNFLKYVHGLYEKGYIDQEILTNTTAQLFEKAKNNYGGYFALSANWLGSWAMDRPPLSVLKNAGASVLMTPGQIGPDGSTGSRRWNATPQQGWFYINRDVTDSAKIETILEFAQFCAYGPLKLNLNFGAEGVDFDMVDGMPVRRAGYVPGGSRGIGSYNQFVQDEEYLTWVNDRMFVATGEYTLGADGLWNQLLRKPYRFDLMNDTKLAELENKYKANITVVVDEFFAAAITGQIDIDAQWAAYLARLDAAHYDEIRAELDKAPLYESFF